MRHLFARLLNRFSAKPQPVPDEYAWFERCVHGAGFLDECKPCPGGVPQTAGGPGGPL